MKIIFTAFILLVLFGCTSGEKKQELELELYTERSLKAPSCGEVDGTEYDGTWDPASSKFNGVLKKCLNGKVYDLCEFKNGFRHGEYLTYDQNGLLMGITNYQNGRKHGAYIQLDESGYMVINATYENDQLISCEGPLCEMIGFTE